MSVSPSTLPDIPPTAPRLSILHVMVSTTITAAVVALIQFMLVYGNDGAFKVDFPPLYAFIIGLAAGPALGMLLGIVAWRWKGFRFPTLAGEWMSLIAAKIVVSQLVIQLAIGQMDDVWHSISVVTQIEIALHAVQSLCLLLGLIVARRLHWRITFVWLLVPSLTWTISFTLNYVTEGFPLQGYDGWLVEFSVASSSFRGAFLVIPVLFALIVDLFRARGFPWTHWLGLALYLWLRCWGFLYPTWFFEISMG